ncbi:hypothetical protein [Flavobacterium sp. DG2-3]|uniref:hypothetical protein n=1 Tax=Flavobacterium sp. DG2-3 TaxID=3068317 RepID=UPI00273DC8CB|nr:hypothetical protein [Flavobacterium sp. DG2-3]MDP5200085.1 hypothetical protein [Flavobacterium sp. DG2-3]
MFFLFSCSKKPEYIIDDLWDNFSFNSTVSKSTQIVIKCYDTEITNKTVEVESFDPSKIMKTSNQKQIDEFDKIFIDAEKTSYCCCPKSSYTIHFFNKQEELDLFYVDTLEFKNKVRICESSYQYSYIIKKENWKNYLFTIMKEKN